MSADFPSPRRLRTISGAVFLISILSTPTFLAADTAVLRSGERVVGRITRQSRLDISITTERGNRVIPKAEIQRITYDDPAEAGKQDDARKAEEAKKAEQLKKEEARKAEEKKIEERQKEETRKVEEAKRRMEEAKRADQLRRSQKEPLLERNEPTPFLGALWRSALLPGWGQTSQGRSEIGLIFAGSMVAVGFTVYANEQRYVRARNEYRTTANLVLMTTPLSLRNADIARVEPLTHAQFLYGIQSASGSRAAMREARANSLRAAAALGFVYVLNLSEVFVFSPRSTTALQIELLPGAIAVRIPL